MLNKSNKNFYLVAGEPSGDSIAASLIKDLKIKNLDICNIFGVGGNLMQEAGLKSLFNIKDISVMGFFNVAIKSRTILKRLNQTVKNILEVNPDILITVDSPGFCYRLVKKLKEFGFKKPCIHYVAPSVWAWKEYRAKRFDELFDHIMCLFPFEVKYFKNSSFVGHPVCKSYLNRKNVIKNEFLILPGSREQEVKTHLPIFLDAINLIKTNYEKKIVTIPSVLDVVEKIVKKHKLKDNIKISLDRDFSKGAMALACNGTIALELAAYNVSFISAYKVSWPLYFILKNIIKTPYINLVNILLNQKVVPEIIQCNSLKLKDAIEGISDQNFDQVMHLLKGDISPIEIIYNHL